MYPPRNYGGSTRNGSSRVLDPAHPFAANLVGCWTFSEGAGLRMQDASSVNNPMSVGTSWASSPIGTSLKRTLTQVDGHHAVTIPPYSFGLNDFTVEAILYVLDTNQAWIVGRDDAASNRDWAVFFHLTAGRVSWFNYVTLTETVFTGFTLAANVRYHVMITRRGTALTCYLNGLLNGTGTDSSNHTKTVDVTVAGRSGSGALCNGNFELVRLWNGRALTAADALSLYEAPYEMFLPQRMSRSYTAPATSGIPHSIMIVAGQNIAAFQ